MKMRLNFLPILAFLCIVSAICGLTSCSGPNSGNFPEASTLDVANPAWFSNEKDFSVSVWVKTDISSADTSIIVSNADFRKKKAGIYGHRRTAKGISLYSCNGGWGWNIGNDGLHYNYEPIAADQPLTDNKWHLLGFTHNAEQKEIRLYYDGMNKAVIKIGDLASRDFKTEHKMNIGGNTDDVPYYASFEGKIDKVNVWDTNISPDFFKEEYARKFSYPDEPQMEKDVLTVVNWNIWHGGTHFTKEENGFDGIERVADMLREADADIVLVQETYGAGSRISSDLGFYYYEAASTIGAVWGANLSIMSRYPLEDAYMIEERSNYGKNYAFNNGGVKIRLTENKSIIAFSNWYNGRKPEDLEGALIGLQNLMDNADNVPIVYGGDFNSSSHLDDGEGKSGHSKLMEKFEFIDSYRTFYPDVEKFPGYSAPRFEDRIDYIYYKGEKLELTDVQPIDPNFRGRNSNTPLYPSDHLGIITRFKIK